VTRLPSSRVVAASSSTRESAGRCSSATDLVCWAGQASTIAASGGADSRKRLLYPPSTALRMSTLVGRRAICSTMAGSTAARAWAIRRTGGLPLHVQVGACEVAPLKGRLRNRPVSKVCEYDVEIGQYPDSIPTIRKSLIYRFARFCPRACSNQCWIEVLSG
jgi:hypothetical protein